ncbi:MAG: glycosyltransferase [Acidimicrobiales bacterium]
MTAHIGYVLKRFPRISETFIAAELIELRRQGQNVTVYALARPDEPFTHRFLDELDVPVVYLPIRPIRQPLRVARAATAVAGRRPLRWLRAAASALVPPTLRGGRRLLQATVLAQELDAAGIDHIHAHFASTAARLANLAHRMGGPPYSVTAHAKDIYHRDERPGRLAETLAGARFVATVSSANVQYLRRMLAGRGQVVLVPNSVDVRRFPVVVRRPDDHRVLVVGRLVEKKGVDVIVRACGLLGRRGVPVRLDVVGDGPLRHDLETLAAAEGVDARFLGALDHDDVLACYQRAAVFALACVVTSTGDRDGLPTVVLEAMASGVPTVTTALNGLSDAVVDERTGLLVPERDPNALADAVQRLLAHPAWAGALGQAGRARVAEHFSLDASVTKLRALFSDMEAVS